MSEPHGIDVSAVGNGVFNWEPWAGYISFAAAKCTEGLPGYGYSNPGSMDDGRDVEFNRNWRIMGDLHLYRFAYHYFHPGIDPASQAEFLIDTATANGDFKEGDNFWCDLEETDELTPVEVSFAAWVFCKRVNELMPGHRIMVYTYPYFAERGNCAKLHDWPLVIADYGVPIPYVPPPWDMLGQTNYVIWQHSATIVDKDLFNGTQEALQDFCTTSGQWLG